MSNKKFILSFFESKDKENVYLQTIKKGKEYILQSSFSMYYSSFDLWKLAKGLSKYFTVKEIENGKYLITD